MRYYPVSRYAVYGAGHRGGAHARHGGAIWSKAWKTARRLAPEAKKVAKTVVKYGKQAYNANEGVKRMVDQGVKQTKNYIDQTGYGDVINPAVNYGVKKTREYLGEGINPVYSGARKIGGVRRPSGRPSRRPSGRPSGVR